MDEMIVRLKAQFNTHTYVAVERVNEAFFGHVKREIFMRKLERLEIAIPFLTFDDSQKAQRYIKIDDLAEYLVRREQQARYEFDKSMEIVQRIGFFGAIALGASIIAALLAMLGAPGFAPVGFPSG